MEKLDQMIEEALEAEDREIFAQTKELGWFTLGLGLFRGKLGWVNWVVMIVQTVMFFAAVWCGIRFFGATDVLVAVKYGIFRRGADAGRAGDEAEHDAANSGGPGDPGSEAGGTDAGTSGGVKRGYGLLKKYVSLEPKLTVLGVDFLPTTCR